MGSGAVDCIVRTTLPVGYRLAFTQAFPLRTSVRGDGEVGENRLPAEGGQRRRIGVRARARGDAEVTGFGVDGPKAAVFTRRHPADVIAHGPDLPARLAVALGRNEHGQVGLAAG